MGVRGPMPLPANVHRIRGNASKLAAHQLDGGVNPEIDIPGCPRHLLPEARKEWRRITPELHHLGLISRIDRAALALYCQAYARWVWCEEQLNRAIQQSAERRAAAEAHWIESGHDISDFVWEDGDGFMLKTPNGSFTYSPHWVGANKAQEQVNRYLGHFGMSPSARGRVTPSSNQLPLPGIDDKPTGGFAAL